MKRSHLFLAGPLAGLLVFAGAAPAVTVSELTARFKDLPTVAEADLAAMPNRPQAFPGLVRHAGLAGHTWVRFPFVENPGSFGFDRRGRLYVAEANRLWLGVPDLRGVNQLIYGDFRATTLEDRERLYEAHRESFPEGFFTRVADRIVLLEDRDGNGAADHRTLFSDRFREPLDGIGFSLLAEDDGVYFTCIPNLWKLSDSDGDGVADVHEKVVEGFGIRVSFVGHDLHGVVRGPDGRLYFSVGDRGYRVELADGTVLTEPGRGAIFRCESDGSGFEVFCRGLRNPQELAFDDFGNLFTFDNTGDIGDEARMVYALEGSDSGWDMAHQSAHHYREVHDWGAFHPPVSMWVAERMFDTFSEAQPQWVYPPASHVARGPSGVTWLTGEALPGDLRGTFLLANYRGAAQNCTVLSVGVEPAGAGYVAVSEEVVAEGVGVTDVAQGYDGKIYLCDFGGGWEVNTQGAVQVLESKDAGRREAGEVLAELFARGVGGEAVEGLVGMLGSVDRRLRQMAQFELAGRGAEGLAALERVAVDGSAPLPARLHGVWGLGQIARQGGGAGVLHGLLADGESEVRANVARELGSIRDAASRDGLIGLLGDESARVRSLAAVALGRVCERGDAGAVEALYALAAENGRGAVDPVLRHACLSGLDAVGTVEMAVARADSVEREVRLMALLYLRRAQSGELARFLDDGDSLLRCEAVRAIYDTAALDGRAGEVLAALDAAEFPATVQRRVVAANYRKAGAEHARRLVVMAGDGRLDPGVRESALHGLLMWESEIEIDPVLGHFRPQVATGRTMAALGEVIGGALRSLLAEEPPAVLAALALDLANRSGVALDEATMRAQAANEGLEGRVRVAALDGVVASVGSAASELVVALMDDPVPAVAAAALRQGFALGVDGAAAVARRQIARGALEVARAGISGLVTTDPSAVASLWEGREAGGVRRELWLDLYLALQESPDAAARARVAAFSGAVSDLSVAGGDPARGESVFRNQGACLQCHQVGGEGGIQGPALTGVGGRLPVEKLVESLVNPSAEIAPGYGLSSLSLNDGRLLSGRIAGRESGVISLVGIDGARSEVPEAEVVSITPPVSAMPPMGLSLAPRDLRDLVAYLASLTTAGGGAGGAAHGEEASAEEITK